MLLLDKFFQGLKFPLLIFMVEPKFFQTCGLLPKEEESVVEINLILILNSVHDRYAEPTCLQRV